MSLFRKVWAEAIAANQELALNRSRGEAQFQHLLEKCPDDGMVYYERGEAYEYLKDFEKAESDYRIAESLFPLKHWKAIAREGLARVQYQKQSPAGQPRPPKDTQTAIIHRIHTVPQLPHEMRVDALSAGMAKVACGRSESQVRARHNAVCADARRFAPSDE
jgi:tetratricopeptide (TPR) repeat protein